MYGHAYPTSSIQQQGQGQQGGASGPGIPGNGNPGQNNGFNFGSMMGMNGLTGAGANGMSMNATDGQAGQLEGVNGSNGLNPALMFNPQLQALLQQQMAQQTSPASHLHQPQQQQQQMRWPGMNATATNVQMNQAGPSQGVSQPPQQQGLQQAQAAGQYGQHFNPFLQQQQQQQQQTFTGVPTMGMPPLNSFAAAFLAQANQQQQRTPGQSNAMQGTSLNPSAFGGAGNADGGAGGMIDPNALMQMSPYGAMQTQGGTNGTTPFPPHMQAAPSMQQHQQSPKPAQNANAGTPEPKAKGRPKGSTKKKKEEAARLQQQQKLQQQQQQHIMQGLPFGQSMPSPAPSFQQTPTPSHSSIPHHASPSVALAQQQERDRSLTQSPSLSGRPTPHTAAPPLSGQGSIAYGAANGAPRSIPTGWMPSLTAAQQQQLLGQALSFSKAQSAKSTNGQPTPSPAHILMQLGYVYVKATVLPNNGQGAGIPGNGASGAGAVLSIDEARMIGILPQPGQSQQQPGAPGQLASAATMQGPPQTPQQSQTLTSTHIQPTQPNASYRASPSAGSVATSIPPLSDSSGNVSSPAKKAASMSNRIRQASVTSRPDSGHGRLSSMSESSHQPGTFTQSTNAMQQQQPMAMGSIPSQAALRPVSSGGPLPSPQMAAQSQGPPLAPVHGGPLPKVTKAGFDVADYNTRLTPLPPSHILTPGATHSALKELWQPLTEAEEGELLGIMKMDGEYTKLINAQAQRNNSILVKRIQDVRPLGGWLHWWERGADEDQSQLGKDGPYESFKIVLPGDKRNVRASQGLRSAFLPSTTSKEVTIERRSASKYEEDLVPIRLEIDYEGWKLRETFTWPAPESYKSEMIDRFAVMLCEDFGLPTMHFVQAIRENILSQVSDHSAAEAIRPVQRKRKRDEAVGRGKLQAGEMQWWKEWRNHIETQDSGRISEMPDCEAGEVQETTEAEMRIQIKLDITVGAMNLVDQFEWDVSDEGSGAEAFAAIFAADLGLSGEFKTAIAHSIREQVDVYLRSLALVGYSFDGKEVLDDELRGSLLSSVVAIARSRQEVDSYTPKLMQLSELEILQSEKERERESRRKRRQTRGRRGINLPDREPLKTARTPAVFGLQQNTSQSAEGLNGSSDLYAPIANIGRLGGVGGETGGRGGLGISTRRAAAAAANAHIAPHSVHDYGTPTPGPEGPMSFASGRKLASKRRRMESYAIHFEYPGGLGRVDESESRGPNFAPSLGEDGLGALGEDRSAELGNGPARGAQHHQHASLTHQQHSGPHTLTTTPSTPVAWNMAKPEEAATQHPTWHDGQWHCSNCGVPGSLDSSRRKGPLGDKTLCGICGKFFHRHRKARPVEYTRDREHHRRELAARGVLNETVPIVDDGIQTQSVADSSALAPVAAAASATAAAVPVSVETLEASSTTSSSLTVPLKVEKDVSFPNTRGNSPDLPFEQVGSPEDSDSSDNSRPPSAIKKSTSEAPRSQSPAKQSTPLTLPSLAGQQARPPSQDSPAPAPAQASSAPVQQQHQSPPDWLTQACHALRLRFPLDRFEIQLRPRGAGVPPPAVAEWRVRCQDCPGKLYTPGPGESLTNFEIHLKNRAHRAAVQKAVQAEGRKAYGSPS